MNEKTTKQHRQGLRITLFILLVLILCKFDKGHASYLLFYDPEWRFPSSIEAVQRLVPLCNFLGTSINKDVHPLFLKKGDSLKKYLENQDVILALLNIHFVLEHHKTYSLIPILVPVKHGMNTHQKALLVMKDSLINEFSDLRGKSLALVPTDRDNLDKQLSLIVKQDISHSHDFFHSIINVVNSESALLALISKASDCALTTLESFDDLDIKIKEHVKVLYLSPPVINSPLVTIKGRMTEQEVNDLRTALLSLHKNSRGRDILSPSGIELFVSVDFDSLTIDFSSQAEKRETFSQVKLKKDITEEDQTKKVMVEPIKREDDTQENLQTEKEIVEPIKHEEDLSGKTKPEKEIVYEIQKGDSLWKIAERLLGSGENYLCILKHNEIENPDLIYFGKKIIIPPRNGCKNVVGEQYHEKRNKKSYPINRSSIDN